ncbi:MAG: glycerophosphodiester phosphodiesterase [Burkholderiaceae bacterium]
MTRPLWPGPRRLAHRGGGALAPENTIAAIRVGIAHGYRAVEFDVMLTADDVPVLMHDPDFGRTITGEGRVAETSSLDLVRRDAGSWFDAERFAGETVPLYEDVVRFCRAHRVWMNVEVKPSPGAEKQTGHIVAETTARLFADEHAAALPLFSSFSIDALVEARAHAPHIARGLLVEELVDGDIEQAHALDCISMHVDHRHLERATVERLHDAGFAILAYTVNDSVRLNALLD